VQRHDRGGRPHRRGDARRATPLRVSRVQARRDQYVAERATAMGLPNQLAAATDYLRAALKRNARYVEPADEQAVNRLIREMAAVAEDIYARGAKAANRERNTPRSSRRKAA
jgi:aromatic ring hydroxylase